MMKFLTLFGISFDFNRIAELDDYPCVACRRQVVSII